MSDLPWQDVTPPKPGQRTFDARYESMCGRGDLICPGEEVCYYQGQVWHVDCADSDTDVPPTPARKSWAPLCGTCWTQHAGECA